MAETTAQVIEQRPPLPPFTPESALEKVRLAEDGWNTRDPAAEGLLTQSLRRYSAR
jgi:nuclear transport factor 2 (NTF2) superfamily protein